MSDRQELEELRRLDELEARASRTAPAQSTATMTADIPQKQAYLADLEKKHGLPAGLLDSVWQQESSRGKRLYNERSGAAGDFQFIPKTAKAYGVDVKDFKSSADGAARMYADLAKQYKGDIPSMLAAYNWGSGNLASKGIENLPEETKKYITEVTGRLPQNNSIGHRLAITGRAAAQGVGQLLDIPVNVMNAGISGYEALTGKDLSKVRGQPVTPLIEAGLTKLGLPEPQNQDERMAVGAGEGMIGGAPFGAAGALTGAGMGALAESGASPELQAAAAIGSMAAGGMKNIGKGVVARGADALAQRTAQLRGQGGEVYNRMDAIGAMLHPDAVKGLYIRIKRSLGDLNDITHAETQRALADLHSYAYGGKPLSLSMLDNVRYNFAQLANAKGGKEISKGIDAVHSIDDFMNNLGGVALTNNSPEAVNLLNTARAKWEKARKFEVVAKAVGDAAGNQQQIKNNLQKILKNDAITRGWTGEEKNALKIASHYGIGENTMGLLGKFGIDIGDLKGKTGWVMPSLVGISTAAETGPSGGMAAGIVAGSTLFKQLSKYLGRGKAENLLQMLERNERIPVEVTRKLPPQFQQMFRNSGNGPRPRPQGPIINQSTALVKGNP